jgi:hypothetical protein
MSIKRLHPTAAGPDAPRPRVNRSHWPDWREER